MRYLLLVLLACTAAVQARPEGELIVYLCALDVTASVSVDVSLASAQACRL